MKISGFIHSQPMSDNAKAFHLKHQRFWLMPDKAIYWQKQKILLVSDLHIGKSGHFRKNGIAVPGQVNKSILNSLDEILDKVSPNHLIILGDLFHSNINNEWHQFVGWRKKYRQLEVSLVIGNHDILNTQTYHSGIINIFKKLTLNPFLLTHNVNNLEDPAASDSYILSGHVHPAVKLSGRGRQSIKLPCFYFGKSFGILPAFGGFTGTHVIEPKKEDKVFLVAEDQILPA